MQVKLNHPDFPRGHEFDVLGVFSIKNGSSHTLTPEEGARIESLSGKSLADYFEGSDSSGLEVTKSEAPKGSDKLETPTPTRGQTNEPTSTSQKGGEQ